MKRGRKPKKSTKDDTNGLDEEHHNDTDNKSDEEVDDEPQAVQSKKKKIKGSKKSEENEKNDEEVPEAKSPKKKKKGKSLKENDDKEANPEDGDDAEEPQYEVEKIMDEKMVKKVRYYLIRWKGYEEESDTWEPEDTLNCPELIKEFNSNKKKNKVGAKKKGRPKKADAPEVDWDENDDFEVDRILEVHQKRDGTREFLVVWKGYSMKESSWEPEENMNCKDLIDKFMEKVDNAKNFDEKELRMNRKHVQRLTYNTPEKNRRLSKRMSGKERVQYFDDD